MANQQQVDIILNLKAQAQNFQSTLGNLQNAFKGINIDKGVKESFLNTFSTLEGELNKFQNKLNSGINTKGALTSLASQQQTISSNFRTLESDLTKLANSTGNTNLKKIITK